MRPEAAGMLKKVVPRLRDPTPLIRLVTITTKPMAHLFDHPSTAGGELRAEGRAAGRASLREALRLHR